ncbi:MAG: HAD family phosphatase [Acidobacteriota bacterium]|nr:HAD family phosphatase [Acidobacteriota bacterium]
MARLKPHSPVFRAIIFDLGRVIVPFDFERGYRQLSALCSMNTQEIRARIGATGLVNEFETGLIEPEPFVSQIVEALGIRMELPEFSRIWNSIFLPETLIPESLLIGLRRHYRLLLLSNTNAIHFSGLEKEYPLLRHFDHLILSYKVRVMKPDPAIYLHAARQAGCAPAECLFIDDLPENAKGAERAGMAALVFNSAEQLMLDFARLGIRCA